jgi:PPM family protein phosphatase
MRSDLEFALESAPGRAHEVNEDALGSAPEHRLWLVADGMGGHAAGDVAAALVRDTMLEQVAAGAALEDAVASAHRAVVEAAAADPSLSGMGSTVVAVRVDDDQARLAWVGDSRGYLLRDGALRCLTRDHSLVQWLLEQGQISAEQAAHHPERNVLVRTLGFEDPQAEVATVALEPGDVLLLCSDGLTGVLSDTDIRRLLLAAATPEAAAALLVGTVVERQGRDDASVAVIRRRARAKLDAGPWLPVAVGAGLGLLVYLMWTWMNA